MIQIAEYRRQSLIVKNISSTGKAYLPKAREIDTKTIMNY